MKLRFLGVLTAFLMFLSLSACATETIAVEAIPVELPEETVMDSVKFVFRNGVTWDASMEEVMASETGECDSETWEEFNVLGYTAVSVSNYSADLVYIFHEDILVSAYYYFDLLPTEDYDYLVAAISSKYGMPITSATSRQATIMNIIVPGDYDLYEVTNWELNDGTYIALFSMDEDEEDEFALMYSNEDALLLIGGIYNTAGL